MSRAFASSKAKAALARSMVGVSTSHIHTDLIALNLIQKYNDFIFSTVGTGVSVSTKTTTQTISTSDTVVLGDATSGNIVLTLPSPSSCYDSVNLVSMILSISKIDSSTNYVRISPSVTETIGGDAFFDLLYQNEVINLITDGTNWYLHN